MSSDDRLRLFAFVLREAGPLFESIFDGFWRNLQDAEVVISSTAFFGAYDGAQLLSASPIAYHLEHPPIA